MSGHDDTTLTEHAGPTAQGDLWSIGIGDAVGPYTILKALGEGGMGVVYLAEQKEPIRRRVALKLIKLGMDTAQVVARFEGERQALALMDHPNVAQVFDAGSTEHGRPYFAMEYVRGEPIADYCDRQRLTIADRIELFTQVCDGVQHAHQKRIIHRDIKASNALVTVTSGRPIPKIIDFGVAKAIERDQAAHTVYTQLGTLIGTPEYMSPEQVEMTAYDIDTRTDVYSLGVLLYELLVGALPFERRGLRQGGFDEMRRRIREDEPSRPSTRLATLGDESSQIARRRRVEPTRLKGQLRGDLDWIVMRALEKDRARRYQTPVDLAADLRRHLAHQPVVAGPPRVTYRAGKFIRRHRFGVAASAVLLLALTLGLIGTTIGFVRATRAERRAVGEAQTATRISELLAGLLGGADPARMGELLKLDLREQVIEARSGRVASDEEVQARLAALDELMRGVNTTDTALRLIDSEILDRASAEISGDLNTEPLLAARLEHVIGETYQSLGLWNRAEPHMREAVRVRARQLGRHDAATLASVDGLAWVCRMQERLDEAEALFVEALDGRRQLLGEEHPDTVASMIGLAELNYAKLNNEDAERYFREALDRQGAILGVDHPDTVLLSSRLASVYHNMARYDEAEALFSDALEKLRVMLPADDPQLLNVMHGLAMVYKNQGRLDDAEPIFLEVLETRRQSQGDDHPYTVNALDMLAFLRWDQGRQDEAERLYRSVLSKRRQILGEDHPATLGSMHILAVVLRTQGRYNEAEPLLREALERQLDVRGRSHPDTLRTLYELACVAAFRGDRAESERVLSEALRAGLRLPELVEESRRAVACENPVFRSVAAQISRNAGPAAAMTKR